MLHVLFALVTVAGTAHANPAPQLGTPQEFSARMQAGTVRVESFDFAAAGFWKLPNRYAWVSQLEFEDGRAAFGWISVDSCTVAGRKAEDNTAWMQVALYSRNAEVWARNVAALRAQLHVLDLATWDALAATGVTPASSRAERLRRRHVWAQIVNDPALDARLEDALPQSAWRYWYGVKRSRVLQVECANIDWLKAQLAEIGWFDIPRFGARADAMAWDLFDRANREFGFKRRIFKGLEKLPPGSTNALELATLTDMVAVDEHRPQRYGTQGSCWWRGVWNLEPVADPEGVDARRASVGLGPLADFVRASKRQCWGNRPGKPPR